MFTIINFEVPDFFRVKVYPLEIFIQYSAFYNESAAAILSIPLLIAALVLIIIQKRFMRNRSYVNIAAGFSSTRLLHNPGKLKWVNILAVCFSLFILGLSAALPLAYLIKSAGPFSNYIRVLETSLEPLIYSIILAGAAAVLTLMHYGAHDTVAALCLIQVVVILVLSGIFYCLRRPGGCLFLIINYKL